MKRPLSRLFHRKRASTPEEVSKYYREWTDRYLRSFGDTFQSHRPDDLKSYFEYLLAAIDIEAGMRVVDAGCGVGGPVFGLASLVDAEFTGVNVSEVQTQIARQRIEAEGAVNVQVLDGDFHRLAAMFEPESVDRVYFLESLVHTKSLGRVISEARKILKPKGKLYVKDLFERVPYSREDERKIKHSIEINNDLFKLFIQPKETLLLVLRKHGFKLDFCRLLEIEAHQDVGNRFVIENHLVKDLSEWHPYLEWYEIRATKVTSEYD